MNGDALGRIDALRAVSRWADAEAAVRAGLATDPQNGELLWRLASVLLQLDRHAEGLAAAQAAVAADPADPDAHRMHALLLVENGRPHEAVHAAYAAVEIAPQHVSVATTYAYALQRAGRLHEAGGVARHAVALGPLEPAAHLRVADIASDAGDLRTARLAYEETLRLDPTHAIARHDLAVLDLRMRHPGRALAGLVAAGKLDPTSPLVLRTVSAVLWQLSWRLRIGLIVAVLLVALTVRGSAGNPSWTARIVATAVLAAAAVVTWRGVRELPAGTGRVIRAALRRDLLLLVTWFVITVCLAIYATVVVIGEGSFALLVWPFMLLLAGIALVARIRQTLRGR